MEELESLANAIKEAYCQDYKTAYHQRRDQEIGIIIKVDRSHFDYLI